MIGNGCLEYCAVSTKLGSRLAAERGSGGGGQLAVSALDAGFGKDNIMPYIYLL